VSTTPESKVKAKVVKMLKHYDVYYFFPATHGFGRSGVPDVVCCVNGKFLAIECKAGLNKLTPLQIREGRAIQQHKGVVMVVNEDRFDTLEQILKELTRHGD
jgi:hypothetical protein